MKRSEQINELVEALSVAQSQIKAPIKNKTMKVPGRDSYNYADLAAVIDVIREPLGKNGLAITQLIEADDRLETTLFHKSGQFISSSYPLGTYSRLQDLGTALTYIRRYSVIAMLSICGEDDQDGKTCDDNPPVNPPKPACAPIRAALTPSVVTTPQSDKEIELRAHLAAANWTGKQFTAMIRAQYKAERVGALTDTQYFSALARIQNTSFAEWSPVAAEASADWQDAVSERVGD